MKRRKFITQFGLAAATTPLAWLPGVKNKKMETKKKFDVIIVGGSYSGLAAAMALGRALLRVLVIDGGQPCNAQTPHSHNFLTQDGKTPAEISSVAKQQVLNYPNVEFLAGIATDAKKTASGFDIRAGAETFEAAKLVFATGIKDVMPAIPGFAECWGISVIHCPYCHGYEVRNERTGILGNGENAFEFARLISNWTNQLTVYTNGKAAFNSQQRVGLEKHSIRIIEKEIAKLGHDNGRIANIAFADGTKSFLSALYSPRPFEQHCAIPEELGCELTADGYLKTDAFQETTIPGIYACGDNSARMRTVANAVSAGTTAGIAASKKIILENF